MEMIRTRYPGAQSFSDDAVSRSIFFGRESETAALTDQIIANRLLVVYAKSGLGKTSLLNAGVAQPLRDDGYIPLFARVNAVHQHPLRSVLDGIRASAERQGIEYHPGNEISLWHFFKTGEFWCDDVLLTPVLVLDQFEELFTLYNDDARAGFLAEVGYLVRGIRPPAERRTSSRPENSEPASQLTDTPPEIRVVLSMREDYLGFLEEASAYIPQILEHRFRLMPLSAEAAAAAIERPTKVQNEYLGTKPFTLRPEAVQGILAYLLRRTRTQAHVSARFVEPFHLQLICQRVETLVARRQRKTRELVEINWTDLGGEKGLKNTLRSFYTSVIRSVQSRRQRKAVRRLCEQYLISPEGRRLSLEEAEINRILKLNRDTLQQLVDWRLLRRDQRADSWYYELSHDSLIAPILTTRRVGGIVFGLLGLVGASFACLLGFVFALAVPIFTFFALPSPPASMGERVDSELTNLGIVTLGSLAVGVLLGWAGVHGVRRSVETLNRFVPPPV
jgi:hypothetical protein